MVIDMKTFASLTALGLVMLPLTAEAHAQTIIQDTFFGDNNAVIQRNVYPSYPQRRVVHQTKKVFKTYKTEKVVNNNTTNNYNTTVVAQASTVPTPAPVQAPTQAAPATRVDVITPAQTTPAPVQMPAPAPVAQSPNVVVNINPPAPAPVPRTCVQQVISLDPYSGYPLAQPYVVRSPGCY